MPNTISRAPRRKSDLAALRRQADANMLRIKALEAHVRQLQALIERIDRPPGAPSPRPTPLDNMEEIVESSQDLRGPSGNLSAAGVASAFGVSLNQLAGWLGKSRQAVSKTPEAK